MRITFDFSKVSEFAVFPMLIKLTCNAKALVDTIDKLLY